MKNFIKINRALAAEKRFYVVLCASLVCAMNVMAEATDSKNVNCDGSVTITATPKAGFHFVQWNDGNTDATRTIADDCQEFDHWSDITDPTDPNYAIVPRDFKYNGVLPTFTAVFKNKVFNVTVNADDATHGDVTVTVLP